MRKILLTLLILSFATVNSAIFAQTNTVVEVTDQSNESLRVTMSNATTALISELNRAYVAGGKPNLSNINMTNEARQNVYQLWEASYIRCLESEVYTRCMVTSRGYQIRNISFLRKEKSQDDKDKNTQDAVINFDHNGTIESFYFAIDSHAYQSIIKANKSITDLRRRQMILDFIENFRTAYNRKDTAYIADMYSDDVLIITGNVREVTTDKASGLTEQQVIFNKQNKEEYMSRLAAVFQKNKYVNIGFEDIYVIEHPTNPNVYGVTLVQKWRTSSYNDDGWLFLAIEFHSDTKMLIHVRTWQPYMLNGRVFPREEVFQIGEFEF